MGITRPHLDGGAIIMETRKATGALEPAVFPLPSRCKIYYGHSRYVSKWCNFLKLVIYLTFDVFAATPTPVRLLCTLLLVIT